MYESFYGLKLDPFLLTPDARFVFAQDNYEEALSHLKYGLIKGEGFVVVTGVPGAGKTTLIEDLLSICHDKDLVIGHLQAAPQQVEDLLRMIEHGFGIEPGPADRVSLVISIQGFLQAQFRYGRKALLIIDEAQNLSADDLEQLRLLANIQSRGGKQHLQVFLLGQPSLRNSIRSQSLEQLRQRIVSFCHLEPLSLEETRAYILHRLKVADWQGDPEFSAAAIVRIHEYCRGIPRRINLVCGRLLLNGLADERHHIGESDVFDVIAEMPPEMVESERVDRDESSAGGTRAMPRTSETAEQSEPVSDPDGFLPEISALSAADVPSVTVGLAASDDADITVAVYDEHDAGAYEKEADMLTPLMAEARPVERRVRKPNRYGFSLSLVLIIVLGVLAMGIYRPAWLGSHWDQWRAEFSPLQTLHSLVFAEPKAEVADQVSDLAVDDGEPSSLNITEPFDMAPESAVKAEENATFVEQAKSIEPLLSAIETVESPEAVDNSHLSVEEAIIAPEAKSVKENVKDNPSSDTITEHRIEASLWVAENDVANRFVDPGVVLQNGKASVSPTLETALRSYSKQITRLGNGSLQVSPFGRSEYTVNRRRWDGKTESSLEGITYVVRNFHSVGVSIVARGSEERISKGRAILARDITDYFKVRGVDPVSVEVIGGVTPVGYTGSGDKYLELELLIAPSL